MCILQERTELIGIYGSCYFSIFYHLISTLVTAVCTCDSPGVCHIHDLGTPVTLRGLKRDLIVCISVSVCILIMECFHNLIKLIDICRNVHSHIVQPLFVDEHNTFCIVLIAGLASGHKRADRSVRPGNNVQSVAEFLIIRNHMRSICF